MGEQKGLREEIDELKELLPNRIKKKKLKIPRKAKVRRGKLKKGWIGIIKIDENGNISGEKQKLEDSTIRLREKTYHAVDGTQIGHWQGKHPVIIQQTWKKNPIKVKRDEEEANETHGQKYIMARMIGDTIKVRSGGGKAILWIAGLAIAGYIGYMLLTGQL